MIDWSKPIAAVHIRDGSRASAAINRDFARKPGGEFIKVGRNIWTGQTQSGTWFFNDEGLAVGGIGPDGYEGRYVLRNA